MRALILLATLLYSHPGQARSLWLASLDHLSLDIHRFSSNREPMTPDIVPSNYKGALQLNWNVGLFGNSVKWDNAINAAGTRSKFTTVYWEYMFRVPTRWGIEPFLYHKSQHTMDVEQPTLWGDDKPTKYPVKDSIGVRITFF